MLGLSTWMRLTLRAGHNLARVGSDIHTRDRLVVSSQLVLELETAALPCVQVDIVVTSYGEGLAVGGEGVVRNWVVKEVVDFGRNHGCVGAVGDSQLLQIRCRA
jgi:hypothetical protein